MRDSEAYFKAIKTLFPLNRNLNTGIIISRHYNFLEALHDMSAAKQPSDSLLFGMALRRNFLGDQNQPSCDSQSQRQENEWSHPSLVV